MKEFVTKKVKKSRLIDIHGINVSLSGRKVLKGISWQLREGEHWAVIGPNGAGKSTFLRLIRGDIWPDPSSPGKRTYYFGRKAQESPVDIRVKIAFVSPERQDAYTRNNWDLSGREVIYTGFSESVYLHRKVRKRESEYAERVIRLLKLEDLKDRRFLDMSEGEARGILIARALVSRPRVLVLDEFCSGLDVSARERMLGLIERIARNGTQVICTTHRVEELVPSISHVILLNSGKIVGQGETGHVLNGDNLSVLMKNNVGSPVSIPAGKSIPHPGSNGACLVRIKNADVYLNGKKVLDGINWHVRKDENWAVLGKNGAGKSTLLKLIRGDLHPALGGEVFRFGEREQTDLWEFRKRSGYVSSELQANYDHPLTVREVVQSGFFSSIGLYGKVSAEQKAAARKWIRFFGLEGVAGRKANSISYGEMRKTLVARAMVNDPDILILDEPCSGLDGSARMEFLDTIGRLTGAGTGIVLVTHHPEDIIRSITHVLIMDKGRIVVNGKMRDVLPSVRKFFRPKGLVRSPQRG